MLIETSAGFGFTGAGCLHRMMEASFRETRVEHLKGPDAMMIDIRQEACSIWPMLNSQNTHED